MTDNTINPSNLKGPNIDFNPPVYISEVKAGKTDPSSPSFKELIAKAIDEVNKLQMEADTAMKEFAKTGAIEKLPEVITKIKQAEIAFDLLVQIRNKVIDAYNDIQRMPL